MTLVSAGPVREHVLKLRAAGGTYESIGRAAGTGAMTVHCIANARRPRVQADVASRLLAVSEAEVRSWRPSSRGIMWRLRALVAMGHTCSRMAAATSVSPATLRRIVRGEAVHEQNAAPEEVHFAFAQRADVGLGAQDRFESVQQQRLRARNDDADRCRGLRRTGMRARALVDIGEGGRHGRWCPCPRASLRHRATQ